MGLLRCLLGGLLLLPRLVKLQGVLHDVRGLLKLPDGHREVALAKREPLHLFVADVFHVLELELVEEGRAL